MKRIDFHEIPDEGLSFVVDDGSWFPEDIIATGQLSAVVHLARAGMRVAVNGSVKATVTLQCDRCLEEFFFPLDFRFNLLLEQMEEVEEEDEKDHFVMEDELDVEFLEGNEIDLVDILRQQVYLNLPMKQLCSDQCLGICTGCGAHLKSGTCSCNDRKESPFSVLAKLKI